MKYDLLIISIPLILCFSACHRGTAGKEESVEDSVTIGADQTGEIIITRDQFETAGMKVGDPASMMFSNEVTANGYIVSSRSARAKINTLIPGRVREVRHSIGEFVKKGEALFSLESHEIIILQQEYAEACQQLTMLKADYKRKTSLRDEKVIAQKDFLKSESEYKTMQAKTEGLKARLRMIHIDPEKVENGTIVSSLSVISPISGVVTRQELVLGQFIEPQVTVMEVVDTQKLQLRLQIFEKDLAGMAVGQHVLFFTPDRRDRQFSATLSHLGKSIDPETKTIQCLAKIDPAEGNVFVNNLYVETRIITCEREVRAIPEQALISDPDRDYALILADEKGDQLTFRKIPVKTGMTRGGFTEVLDEGLTSVLLIGAYSLGSDD